MIAMTTEKPWEQGANEEQLAVMRHHEGPLRVAAQAGSGKTHSLTGRIAALVSAGVDPSRIFAVTFSKKAATEMDERVARLGIEGVQVQTWHAFALRVLREDGTPYAPPHRTIDEKDKEKTIVKTIVGYKHLKWDGADVTKIRSFFGHCKANLLEWNDPATLALAKARFGGYRGELAVQALKLRDAHMEEARLVSFDDMLVFAHRHLQDDFNRRQWAGRFDHVLTDEAQDNNLVQVELARALARDHRNLMVVGDVAQAIYGFRGSKPDYLVAFQEEWSARDITMNRNYRSARTIVALANAVIRPATIRVPTDMIAARADAGEGTATLVRAGTFDDEASEVAAWVKANKEGGRRYSDMTVLFRLNAQSRALEDALLRERIPYLIVGGVNFWQRKEVKDLLAYLRVAAGRDTEGDGVKRCINAPFRFLGAKFTERLMATADATGRSDWGRLVQEVARETDPSGRRLAQSRQVDSALEWSRMVADAAAAIEGDDEEAARPAAILESIVKRSGYIAWLEKEEGEESIEASHAANVREVLRVAASFAKVGALLDYIDENVKATAKAKKATGDRVLLMSIHRSKGLEWPLVWVVGCNEAVLPHHRGDVEEERRLAYVAVTRARDEVVCSYVTELTTRAGIAPGRLSRFLAGDEAAAVLTVRSSREDGAEAAAEAERARLARLEAEQPGLLFSQEYKDAAAREAAETKGVVSEGSE